MKIRKKMVYIIIASVLCSTLPSVIIPVHAEEEPVLIEVEPLEDYDNGTDESGEIAGYHPLSYELETVEQIQPYSLVSQSAVWLPEDYDSRDYGRITPVKNQNPYGTCWAFAAMNSAEADGIMDHRMEVSSADLSEAQFAYFFYHRVSDPLGGTEGDLVSTSGNYLTVGGNNQLSTFALATWISPVEESFMEYGSIGGYSPANVDTKLAYRSAAHLQNSYWIPMWDRDTIKQMIVEYGAVATSYYSAGSYYSADNKYYYCPGNKYSQNHAVSIVGWDDTIAAAQFATRGYTPSEDGGWLIKNSYGSGFGDAGYFWISYADQSLLNALSNSGAISSNLGVVFDYEAADNYDHNYQYDGTVSLSQLQYASLSSCYTANVFTTQTAEDLKAVGFYTTQPGMGYQIQIYRNVGEHAPLGTPALTTPVTGAAEYAGYHTVSLGSEIQLNAGETYSVVIQYTSASSGVSFFVDRTIQYDWVRCISASKTGQGYYSSNGTTWQDCSDAGYGNLRIKAFTDTNSTRITGIQVSSMNLSLKEQKSLSVILTPAAASKSDLVFSSSNSSVVTVSGEGILTGVSPGSATITVSSRTTDVRASAVITVYNQTQSFCARLYEKCLGRQAEPKGLAYWNQMLVSGTKSGAQVGYGFVFSDEYKNKHTSDEDYIEMLYQVFMNRPSDASGKNYWLGILNKGVSREYVFRGFAHSQEYTNICNSYGIERGTVSLSQPRDKNPNLTAFVNRIYEKAMERQGEEDGLNYWCSMIQSGRKTPVQAAEYFLTSQEFRNKNLSNEAYIKVLYRTFMDRECDQAGLNYWLGELNRGCTREEVLRRFAGCPEFKNIIASFGL